MNRLIAMLLVVVEMTAEEALEEFTSLAIKVFKDIDENPEIQTHKLGKAIKFILNKQGVDENTPLISSSGTSPVCKLYV